MDKPVSKDPHNKGFALVVALSLMILLTVVAVGLLTLSSISLRSSSQGVAQAAAQANARMALMIAIGELQKQLGPDQRVSANGAILATTTVQHPNWAGVWNSWQAGTQAAGTTSPDTPSEHRTILGAGNNGMSPTYEAQRGDHFRAWLVSLSQNQAADISSAMSLSLTGTAKPSATDNAVQLVGLKSLGPEANVADHVKVGLLPIQSSGSATTASGRYGWWVGDESQKARIMGDSYKLNPTSTLADRLFRHTAPGSTGTVVAKGLEAVTDETRLGNLPTLETMNLLEGATGKPSRNFHNVTPFSRAVLADVREGGLKRDLTTLLERPIDPDEVYNYTTVNLGPPFKRVTSLKPKADDFMLYRFDSGTGEAAVPVQDLAAYYQLYDSSRPTGRDGMKYSSSPVSNLLPNGLQVPAPDYGNNTDTSKYLRNYTTLYRRPVPVKIQFLLGMTAVARTPTPENPDTHKLQLGITPSVTLWNPNNVPIVMNYNPGNPYLYTEMLRLSNTPFLIRWNKNNGQYVSNGGVHMTWASQGGGGGKANIFSLLFSGNNPIVFKPGEVRVFSLPWTPGALSFSKLGDEFIPYHEVTGGWDPNAFLLMPRSDPNANATHVDGYCLTFKPSDSIAFKVTAENPPTGNEIPGSGLQFFMIQKSLQNRLGTGAVWHYRDYQFISRYGTATADFNISLARKGFPGGGLEFTAPSRSGSRIIAASNPATGGMEAFLQFALMAGCETRESANGGSFGGRKFASRPFLHSTAMCPPFLDKDDNESFYHYGWNWWVQNVNSILEANVQVDRNGDGFYGGGYTAENGTTHVVQQDIPAAPPMSIAALSHAHLGGFSLATEPAAEDYGGLVAPEFRESFQRVTATGQAGLLPHTLQAIGNSYAHPSIAADKAAQTRTRLFSTNVGEKTQYMADHSYLANKALWDDCFFSSMSPAPSSVKIFGGGDRSAKDAATNFFFPATPAAFKPLPNRRMVPYTANIDKTKLNALFAKSANFKDGLADQIAAHLLVEGPFNINSTSVEAWKIFLSSLKGKPVAYLDKDKALSGGLALETVTPAGTPVGQGTLSNGKPFTGSTTAPSAPEQWNSWRELSNDEISKLATAIVKQVKLRGPFLSLSEFVNRRLDGSNKTLSLKGALQAALDDSSVPINTGFRNTSRRFSSAELAGMNPVFPEALAGPVAYGSAAYVDQADILRNFAEQLTPRGDTFVIRSYGDSFDPKGNVMARAWCEAVVQRTPEYLDPADEPHVKQADLKSAANKIFGRKLRLVGFRWLTPNEI